MRMINSIRCHSLPQITALLYRGRQVVRLTRQGHESGGVRTKRGGEPGQSATPAHGAGLALQLTNGADTDPGPARQRLLR
jgi:hypothetical protein